MKEWLEVTKVGVEDRLGDREGVIGRKIVNDHGLGTGKGIMKRRTEELSDDIGRRYGEREWDILRKWNCPR